jgi:RNA polymerase sigma-70 factor (ECF subfamily)
MQRAADISDEDHLLLWSRRAARFKALEALRNRTYRATSLDEDVLEMLEADWVSADSLVVREEVDHLRECVGQLTPHAQKILHLRYTEGLSGARVAEIVNVKVRSVYVALARIHQALADCIRKRRFRAEPVHD